MRGGETSIIAPPTKRDGDHDMSDDETVTSIILARLERIEGKTTP